MHECKKSYLATLHVSTLPSMEQSSLMKKTFNLDHRLKLHVDNVCGNFGSQSADLSSLDKFVESDGLLIKDHSMLIKKYLFLFNVI